MSQHTAITNLNCCPYTFAYVNLGFLMGLPHLVLKLCFVWAIAVITLEIKL